MNYVIVNKSRKIFNPAQLVIYSSVSVIFIDGFRMQQAWVKVFFFTSRRWSHYIRLSVSWKKIKKFPMINLKNLINPSLVQFLCSALMNNLDNWVFSPNCLWNLNSSSRRQPHGGARATIGRRKDLMIIFYTEEHYSRKKYMWKYYSKVNV